MELRAGGFHAGSDRSVSADFWLPQLNAWAEIKPVEPTLLELQKARALSIGTSNPVLLLVGKPAMASYWAIWEGCGLVKPWKPGDDPEERVHADDITYKRSWRTAAASESVISTGVSVSGIGRSIARQRPSTGDSATVSGR